MEYMDDVQFFIIDYEITITFRQAQSLKSCYYYYYYNFTCGFCGSEPFSLGPILVGLLTHFLELITRPSDYLNKNSGLNSFTYLDA
jgi:hypothetical protein